MSVTALVGGQYGSEGKGKIAAYLAPAFQMAIRTGGPNAGHSFEFAGQSYSVQSVPCTFINRTCLLGIGAGGVLDLEVLEREIRECRLSPERLMIDPKAAMISARHRRAEAGLVKRIGSTGKGVGAAIAAKVRRNQDLKLARDVPRLAQYIGDVAGKANEIVDAGGAILLEGTQGFGLSLHHGQYPKVTGRDTTAGTLCADAGLSPRLVTEIIMVVRTYPIRVAGESGPLMDEIDWDTVTCEAGSSEPLIEYTTVTKKVRRVGRFDVEWVRRAALVNRPTQIALTFVDYLDHANRGVRRFKKLTLRARRFVEMVEQEIGVPVTLIGTGQKHGDLIDRRRTRVSTP